jgi:hypothetical protein
MDYSFVSDPPIFADIGETDLLLSGLCLSFDAKSVYDPSLDAANRFNLTISDLRLDWLDSEPLLDINGYSDFGGVVNNTINILATVVKNRLSSLINNEGILTPKLNSFLYKITSSITGELDIGEDLYLYGWLFDAITTVPESMTLPLKVALKSDLEDYTEECATVLPDTWPDGGDRYALQMYINTCAFNEALFSLYTTNLNITIQNENTTSNRLAKLVGHDMISIYGRADDPCTLSVAANRGAPTITYSTANGESYLF